MGRWGIGTFESDEASEWADAFNVAEDPVAVLEDALPADPNDLDDFTVEHVLCAAEAIIAILSTRRVESRISFDDPTPYEADAVRLKPRCMMLLQRLLAQDIGLNALLFDNPKNPNTEWEAEVRVLVNDLENT